MLIGSLDLFDCLVRIGFVVFLFTAWGLWWARWQEVVVSMVMMLGILIPYCTFDYFEKILLKWGMYKWLASSTVVIIYTAVFFVLMMFIVIVDSIPD